MSIFVPHSYAIGLKVPKVSIEELVSQTDMCLRGSKEDFLRGENETLELWDFKGKKSVQKIEFCKEKRKWEIGFQGFAWSVQKLTEGGLEKKVGWQGKTQHNIGNCSFIIACLKIVVSIQKAYDKGLMTKNVSLLFSCLSIWNEFLVGGQQSAQDTLIE